MLYLLSSVFGFSLGVIVMIIKNKRQTIYGVIDIDHQTEMVNFRANSSELKELYNKQIIFKINHNSTISRDEHIL